MVSLCLRLMSRLVIVMIISAVADTTGLMGNISHIDEQPFAHLHATFGTNQYETLSGHLTKPINSNGSSINFFSYVCVSRL
jgi:hypothetical protein